MWQPYHVFPCALCGKRPSALCDPNSLDIHELPDPEDSQFPSMPRLLDAAKRNARIRRHHLVDEDHPGFQFIDEALTLPLIVGPRARPQAKTAVIGDADRLVDILDTKQRRDRTKKLLAIC